MKLVYSLIILLFSMIPAYGQVQYWVEFSDKEDAPFSLEEPEYFLSKNAINRRIHFSIPITESDLPVNQNYIEGVEKLDAKLRKKSKWLNASLFESSDPNFLQRVSQLKFVAKVTPILIANHKKNLGKLDVHATVVDASVQTDGKYGYSSVQMDMVNGRFLHDRGHKGSTIDIGVMDNGFENVDSNRFFVQANLDNRIHAGYNFVNNSLDVYSNGGHGAYVMSTLAANVEDTLIGTAPDASFYLFSTEDANSEGLHEEINWAMAAEWADSALGTWVVLTTSLGYSNGFTDPSTEHTYADMDGNTTIITRAADLAAQKGMLVVNSAGNEALVPWRYITAPADGDSVMAVGAVDSERLAADFSSFGPSADNRVKPNVSALGQQVVAVNQNEEFKAISGTSFSCPIMAGLSACLWEAFPNRNNMEVIAAIEKSADFFYSPDEQIGLGIPNFEIAFEILELQETGNTEIGFVIYPNPVDDKLNFWFLQENQGDYDVIVADMSGKVWLQIANKSNIYNRNSLGVENLPKGIYTLFIQQGKNKFDKKFVKL